MVETDQFRYELNSYDEPLKELRSALDLDNKAKKIEELAFGMIRRLHRRNLRN